jgi:hypothetical protein
MSALGHMQFIVSITKAAAEQYAKSQNKHKIEPHTQIDSHSGESTPALFANCVKQIRI